LIEAAGNYVLLHAGKENHIVRETLTSRGAAPDAFFRVSRSAILNLRRIRELQSVTPASMSPSSLMRSVSRLREQFGGRGAVAFYEQA
jgi:hypothetical protein